MSLNIKPQLAKHLHLELEKKKPATEGKSYGIFEKYDGWYGYLDFPSCIIHSRKMREIPALVDLSNEIRLNAPNIKGRLIFEIMIEGLEIDSFHELNGILNRKNEQAEEAYLMVHDFVIDWREDVKFDTRYQIAKSVVSNMGMEQVQLAPILITTTNLDVCKLTAQNVWAQGGEGIIMKDMSAGYQPGKRNASLLKIKEELTVEMLVVDIKEGQGEHSGIAGSLICADEHGTTHEIGMGAMSHADRKRAWEDKFVLDAVVEIKAMKKLPNGSYREPRFKAVRYDKGHHELG